MVSSKKMRGLIGFDEAIDACGWQVAEGYYVYGGEILPDPEAGWWKFTIDKPLADPNLFLGFARLGGRGNDLPEALILQWVRKHGLLRLKDSGTDRLSLENQAPVKLDEFREEAQRAHQASTLFAAIHSEDWGAIRSRIGLRRVDLPGIVGKSSSASVYLDGLPTPVMRDAARTLPDQEVRMIAVNGLEGFVQEKLKDVSLSFDHYSGHPRPQEIYRPRLVFRVPDLYSAIWYQFASLMADTRPVKFCEICEGPIYRPRQDQKTCSDACRQAKRRRKQEHGGPA